MTAPTQERPLALRRLKPIEATSEEAAGQASVQYRTTRDLYRQRWTWDSVVKVTHHRVNCNNACSYNAYVRDGIVWREEQNANYEQPAAGVPDFGPRGCAPGCSYAVQMYDPTRLKYPLKRAGERGSGKWERISWEQAYDEIADKLLDIIEEDGSECILYESGPNADFGIGSTMESHLFSSGLGGVTVDVQSGVGDLPTGLIQTYGLYMLEGTSDDWFLSDYVLIWISNPAYTRQSDYHFTLEARYRGAKVVCISPDYNASTMHSDLWMNVRYGTDAALALGMCNVIVEEGLFKPDYIKEQTDLPFLVRDDTQRFLRQSDVIEGGQDDIFYFWNTVTGRKEEAPGTWGSTAQTIALDSDCEPALEGAHRVRLKDGRRVTVRPFFELLCRQLAPYSPEAAGDICGIHPDAIRKVAREFAAAKAAMIHSSWGACKHYHSDLFQRGMAYLCALTGNAGGKPGTGIKVGALWPAPFASLTMGANAPRLNTEPVPDMPIDRISMLQLAKQTYMAANAGVSEGNGRTGPVTTLVPFLYTHSPAWREIASRQEYNDPALTRPVAAYMDDIVKKGWQPVAPRPGKRPRFYFVSGTNIMRRWPNPKAIREDLWPGLDMVVTSDVKMSTTALWSDYVLPACGWYEKPGIKYTMSYVPYVVAGDRAVQPLYESKHEWDMVLQLSRVIQNKARERGMQPYADASGRQHDLTSLHDALTADGAYPEGEEGERKALSHIFQNSLITRASDLGEDAWDKVRDEGMIRIKSTKPSALFGGVYSDFDGEQPMHSGDWFIQQKNPWPTLTGRQQFYLDHDWFLEIGEQLATHKEVLPAGGDYPLRLTSGHTRWSMHSVFRTNEVMLNLQRGVPVAYISEPDALARGIQDNDQIKVFNDVGSFELVAKVSPSMAPGVVLVYHAWEGYQFPGWAVQNDVDPTPPKPTNMIGNYGHLHHRMGSYTMNHTPKEVAVDIVRVP
jgi:DMSO reductase family type II enzyme molybdopterin subunit